MSSSWPPELKAWVQECLSKATPSNKTAVNLELKQVLFKAHADGTLNSTDWSKVELQALKAQAHRTTHVLQAQPSPYAARSAQAIPPPNAVPGPFSSYPAHYSAPNPYPAPNPYSTPHGGPSTNGGPSGQKVDAPLNTKKKKRKNDDDSSKSMLTPYHFTTLAESEALARRAARFSKPGLGGGGADPNSMGASEWFDPDEQDMLAGAMGPKKRLRGKGGLGYGGVEAMEIDPNVIDWDHFTIKGTSTKLEKSYLRLTSEPSPADIRPLPILKQTLHLLKTKWKDNHNYAYAVDQFKSMRQDLTKDLGEYNQCQSMLRQLYELGIGGHPQEFLSYRIIYLLHTKNRSDMASLLAQLTPAEKADPSIHHALQVHASLATSNYARFFRLFNTAPNMSGYIMDHFVERERMAALAVMSKAYITLPLAYITRLLAFENEEDAHNFLEHHEAAIFTNPTLPETAPAAKTKSAAWNPAPKPKPTPLAELIWDAKKAAGQIVRGLEKYRIVDLKGQVV